MKTLKLGFLAAVLMIAGAVTVKAQSADDVIDKYAAAIGGKDNWQKVTSMKMDGTVNAQGQEIGIVITQVHNKATKSEISVMGMTGYTIVTNKEGWMMFPWMGHTKPEAFTEDQVKQAQDDLDLQHSDLFDYKAKGNKVEYLGKDDVEGTACHKVKLTMKSGSERTLFFDASNYYLIQETEKVTVDGKTQEATVSMSNYQKQSNGLVFPMTVDQGQGAATFKSVEFNKTYDDSVFKPATN